MAPPLIVMEESETCLQMTRNGQTTAEGRVVPERTQRGRAEGSSGSSLGPRPGFMGPCPHFQFGEVMTHLRVLVPSIVESEAQRR